jgi:hypothetical protein
MAPRTWSSHDTHLVLYSSTHVLFLEMSEHHLAEVFKKKDVNFRNGTIEPINRLPSDIQIGRIYRHYSPIEKNSFT